MPGRGSREIRAGEAAPFCALDFRKFDGCITIATSKKDRKAQFIGFVTVFVLVCSGFDLNFIGFWRLLNIVMPVMSVDFHRI